MYFKELKTKHSWSDFKIKILNRWFFQELVEDFEEITSLSKQERNFLKTNYSLSSLKLLKLLEQERTDDENTVTKKAVFELKDGNKIETVLMQFKDGRNSVCVSSQVGCPVGCVFCATGQMGFKRNLIAKEIVDQVLFFARNIKNPISNIVYMGMGEPMLNYENVIESLRIFTNPDEFTMSPRRITVSTCGYVDQLYKFMKEDIKTKLAISLHAPNQKLREKLMPVAKKYTLDELFKFISDWEKVTNKRVSYEYTLIKNINDKPEHANELSKLLRNRLAHVNLIPMNPIPNNDEFQKPSRNKILQFADILRKNGIETTIRITMGDEIKAACGQLAG